MNNVYGAQREAKREERRTMTKASEWILSSPEHLVAFHDLKPKDGASLPEWVCMQQVEQRYPCDDCELIACINGRASGQIG